MSNTNDFNANKPIKQSNARKKFLSPIRVSEEEWKMAEALKAHPHYTNLSQYFRNCIRHLYKSKFETKDKKDANTPKPT